MVVAVTAMLMHPLDAPNTRADLAPLRGGEGRAARDCVGQGSCALEGR